MESVDKEQKQGISTAAKVLIAITLACVALAEALPVARALLSQG